MTEKTTTVEPGGEKIVEQRTELVVQKPGMSRQGIIVTAIISSAALFFIGGGFGFFLGNRYSNHFYGMRMMDEARIYNGQRPGGMRRGYYQNSTQTTPVAPTQGATSTNPQAN